MPAPGSDDFDQLYKIRPFLEDLKTNFKLQYDPHREQAVDEALVKFKGRTSLKQYMPMNPIKRGIKLLFVQQTKQRKKQAFIVQTVMLACVRPCASKFITKLNEQ